MVLTFIIIFLGLILGIYLPKLFDILIKNTIDKTLNKIELNQNLPKINKNINVTNIEIDKIKDIIYSDDLKTPMYSLKEEKSSIEYRFLNYHQLSKNFPEYTISCSNLNYNSNIFAMCINYDSRITNIQKDLKLIASVLSYNNIDFIIKENGDIYKNSYILFTNCQKSA